MRRADAHEPLHMPVLQAAERLVVNGQDMPRVAQQALAMVGQPLLAALFLEQRVADSFFQLLHLLGDGRLRAPQLHGRAGKAFLAGNGGQGAELVQIQCFHISVSLKYMVELVGLFTLEWLATLANRACYAPMCP